MPDRRTFQNLMEKYSGLDGIELLRAFLVTEMPGQIAAVSSFGTESAVLLHMISRVDKSAPVIFLDTLKHFDETLLYREELTALLGLSNVRIASPDPSGLQLSDPQEDLCQKNPDACCRLRKVLPLEKELAPFSGWITGRKHFQGHQRAALPPVEFIDGKLKLNPLAGFSQDDIRDYFKAHALPRHPLWEKGYTSVGCKPCTQVPASAEDVRSGRWAGSAKTECGIHLPRTTEE